MDCNAGAQKLLKLIETLTRHPDHDVHVRGLMDDYLNRYPWKARELYDKLPSKFRPEFRENYKQRGGDLLAFDLNQTKQTVLSKTYAGGEESLRRFQQKNPERQVYLKFDDGRSFGPGKYKIDEKGVVTIIENGVPRIIGKGHSVIGITPIREVIILKPLADGNTKKGAVEEQRLAVDQAVVYRRGGAEIPAKVAYIDGDGNLFVTYVDPVTKIETFGSIARANIATEVKFSPTPKTETTAKGSNVGSEYYRVGWDVIIHRESGDTPGKVMSINEDGSISVIFEANGSVATKKISADAVRTQLTIAPMKPRTGSYDLRLFGKGRPVIVKGRFGYIDGFVTDVAPDGSVVVTYSDNNLSLQSKTFKPGEVNDNLTPYTKQVGLDLTPSTEVKVYSKEYGGWVFAKVKEIKMDGSVEVELSIRDTFLNPKAPFRRTISAQDIDTQIKPRSEALNDSRVFFDMPDGSKYQSTSKQLVDVFPWSKHFIEPIKVSQAYKKIMSNALFDMNKKFPLGFGKNTKQRLAEDPALRKQFYEELYKTMERANSKESPGQYGNNRNQAVKDGMGFATICEAGMGVCLETSIYYHAILSEYGIPSYLESGSAKRTKIENGVEVDDTAYHAWVRIPGDDVVINANWDSGERGLFSSQTFYRNTGYRVENAMQAFAPVEPLRLNTNR